MRTALSLLIGLRQKFSREANKDISYSAYELSLMLNERLRELNKQEVVKEIKDTDLIENSFRDNEVWDVITDEIHRSRIKRYKWKKILGETLTQYILKLKLKGYTLEQVFDDLLMNPKVTDFINRNPSEEENLVKNLKISVHARFGENDTANKVESMLR